MGCYVIKHFFLGLTRFLSFSPLQKCMMRVTNDNSTRRLQTYLNLTHSFLPPSLLNPLPNNKSLDWSKLKAFVDDKINVNKKNLKYVFGKVENIVGKGEKAGYQRCLLFPQCFQKASVSGSLKVGIVW